MSAASPHGTEEYFNRFPRFQPRKLGSTDLLVSPIGFGSYRVSQNEPDHREALKHSLLSGVNLIDTSTNYGDGSGAAEKLIGQVLSELFASQKLKREEIVIVTKIGYVQGENLREARNRLAGGTPLPDMVMYQDQCWHNISPEYLEEQIGQSIARMGLSCIDAVLLHNPEYFLKTAKQPEVYYARIKKAFAYLESEVERGRIKYYGVSSNTFVDNENTLEATSLEKCFALAKEIKKNNHFAVVQFPLNLFETNAATLKNNSGKSILEFAQANKLATLANRPLNAFNQGELWRLSSFPEYDIVEIKGEMHRVLGRVIELEKKQIGTPRHQGLMWGQALRENLQQLDDVLNWREILYRQILPSLEAGLHRLAPDQQKWGDEYRTAALDLLSLISKNLESHAAQKSGVIKNQVSEKIPELKDATSLSQMVVRLYMGLKGLTTVLVGMRTPAYVDDMLKAVKPAPEKQALETLISFSKK